MNQLNVPQADVFVDQDLPVTIERDLVAALGAAGLHAAAKVTAVRRGVGQLPWLILVAVPLQAFLTAMAQAAAGDAWAQFKKIMRRLPAHEKNSEDRYVMVQDPATGLQLMLPPDLPDEGYRQLSELDPAKFTHGPLRYDRKARHWTAD